MVVCNALPLPVQQYYITKMMVDFLCHFNVFLSLFNVSGLLNVNEHIFPGILLSGCFQISHMRLGKQYVGI